MEVDEILNWYKKDHTMFHKIKKTNNKREKSRNNMWFSEKLMSKHTDQQIKTHQE